MSSSFLSDLGVSNSGNYIFLRISSKNLLFALSFWRDQTYLAMLDVLFAFTGCTNNIETMNVTVGQTVRLKCPRTTSATLSWIRLVPGTLPELLGKSAEHTKDSHFTTKMESRLFVLAIKNPRVNDTGVYLCMTVKSIFLKRVDLTVIGEYPAGLDIVHLGISQFIFQYSFVPNFVLESEGDSVPTVHPHDPTPGERSALLQCSVLSDSENATSLDDLNSRCCGSRSVGPFFSFHCRNNMEVEENNLKRSRNSVVSKISSSGDLCCSIGKCEQTCENCSEPEIEGKS